MKSVWKYPLVFGLNTFTMPGDEQPLTVQYQGPVIMMWALVEPTAPPVSVTFLVTGTGFLDVPIDNVYVGTVQDAAGFVWHAFKVR